MRLWARLSPTLPTHRQAHVDRLKYHSLAFYRSFHREIHIYFDQHIFYPSCMNDGHLLAFNLSCLIVIFVRSAAWTDVFPPSFSFALSLCLSRCQVTSLLAMSRRSDKKERGVGLSLPPATEVSLSPSIIHIIFNLTR